MTLPDASTLLALFGHFLLLSLLSIGGAITVAPDMHRWMVVEQHLLSDPQFASSIAIAQAAPGPNVLFVAVLGYQVAGLAGAAATLLGIMLPSVTLALLVNRWGHARQDWRAVRAFKAGMAPITLALIAATGWLLAAPPSEWRSLLTTAAAALLVWRTRLHLLWMIAAGALLGALGWV
ncbi:chromate transporter [Methylibium sp.]|uniref:chromate transporter n=1 Tax=Methylibium sp. TaxID=2067992 RepID=UPI003D0AEA2D